MKTNIRFPPKVTMVAASLALAGALAGCTECTWQMGSCLWPRTWQKDFAGWGDLPPELHPDPRETPLLSYWALGDQIYACKAGANGTPAWTFVAPDADLFDAKGTKTVDHGAGPSWEHRDGSKVIGSVSQRVDARAEGAIPWLLLSATSVGGPGVLAGVTSIQRINTRGGVAPVQGCSRASDIGTQARVPYSAVYIFYAAQ